MSVVITDAIIEAEARAMMRETIVCSGWYPYLPSKGREKRICLDIDHHWPLMAADALREIEARARLGGQG